MSQDSATTWTEIAGTLETRGGVHEFGSGRMRGWRVPSPTGGSFLVEVTLRPRWCYLAVDRFRTTDRDKSQSDEWFEEHAWPVVKRALETRRGWGTSPYGRCFASASPVDRGDLLELLTAWVDKEMVWGLSPDQDLAGWIGR